MVVVVTVVVGATVVVVGAAVVEGAAVVVVTTTVEVVVGPFVEDGAAVVVVGAVVGAVVVAVVEGGLDEFDPPVVDCGAEVSVVDDWPVVVAGAAVVAGALALEGASVVDGSDDDAGEVTEIGAELSVLVAAPSALASPDSTCCSTSPWGWATEVSMISPAPIARIDRSTSATSAASTGCPSAPSAAAPGSTSWRPVGSVELATSAALAVGPSATTTPANPSALAEPTDARSARSPNGRDRIAPPETFARRLSRGVSLTGCDCKHRHAWRPHSCDRPVTEM